MALARNYVSSCRVVKERNWYTCLHSVLLVGRPYQQTSTIAHPTQRSALKEAAPPTW